MVLPSLLFFSFPFFSDFDLALFSFNSILSVSLLRIHDPNVSRGWCWSFDKQNDEILPGRHTVANTASSADPLYAGQFQHSNDPMPMPMPMPILAISNPRSQMPMPDAIMPLPKFVVCLLFMLSWAWPMSGNLAIISTFIFRISLLLYYCI